AGPRPPPAPGRRSETAPRRWRAPRPGRSAPAGPSPPEGRTRPLRDRWAFGRPPGTPGRGPGEAAPRSPAPPWPLREAAQGRGRAAGRALPGRRPAGRTGPRRAGRSEAIAPPPGGGAGALLGRGAPPRGWARGGEAAGNPAGDLRGRPGPAAGPARAP